MTFIRSGLSLRLTFLFAVLISASAGAQTRPVGADVSGYQTSINWTTVKNAGIVFVWAKATEGTYYYNPYFTNQEASAKTAHIYIGAYHFARPSSDPNLTGANSADSEAAYFWSVAGAYVKNGGVTLVPMLDWEDNYATNGHNGLTFTAASLSAWANEWCKAVSNTAYAAGVTLTPVIYTGTWYSIPSGTYAGLNTSITNWPNWMPSYPTTPNVQAGYPSPNTPWSNWSIWQYADTNASGGDSDVFNGTLNDFLQKFLIGTTIPTNQTVALGSGAAWAVNVTITKPYTNQWLFNGTPIAGATATNYLDQNVQMTDAGGYTLMVSNSFGAYPLGPIFLSVMGPITNAPNSILAPASLVNWWKGDGNFLDAYGTYTAIPHGGFSYTNGEVGQAFHFDGSTGYLLINGGGASLAPNWTACMWVNRQNALGTSGSLMGDNTYALKLEQYNTTRQVGFTVSGAGDYLFNPHYSVPANTWTHLAFVATSTTVSLYTNGVLEGSTNVSNVHLPRASIGVDLLSGSPTDYLMGSLDDLQVYSSALTAAQIKSIYTAGSAGLVGAPEFTGTAINGSGQMQLNLRGLTGKNISLYGSTDLVNWSLLTTLANPTGAVQYVESPTATQKFYQAKQ